MKPAITVTVARRDDKSEKPLYMVFAHRKGARVHYCNTSADAQAMKRKVEAFERRRAARKAVAA